VFDVEMTLFPRVEIGKAGIAPMTSMFYFDASDRDGIDDYRPATADSDGLEMRTGRGERLWRQLSNPADLRHSAFADTNPVGFGLMQRKRDFRAFQDLEAHYERRPSLWIEPIGDWGEGAVHLVEIPTKEEIHDNVVAFWRPHEPFRPKLEYLYRYRMHWGWKAPADSGLAAVAATRVGRGSEEGRRLVVIDIEGETLQALPAGAQPVGEVSASRGKIANAVAQPNVETGGWRISFELLPEGEEVVDLRARLVDGKTPLSETWTWQWAP
jgi:glucans biosynthesis protein